jgi:hypothetical protein
MKKLSTKVPPKPSENPNYPSKNHEKPSGPNRGNN